MKIETFSNYNSLSKKAAKLIHSSILKKPASLLCAASGNSTLKTYQMLFEKFSANPGDFKYLKVLKLDEWGGIPMEHPGTCESFLQENIIKPLQIPKSQYISFQSNPENKEKECDKISHYLKEQGPIDLCVLGLGMNGHIAFNEPGDSLLPHCHIAELSTTSLNHSMTDQMATKPTFGLSLGMKDILQSRQIIIILTGLKKNEVAKEFLSQKITTRLPASFLWLHENTTCLINEDDIKI
ncbi:MAG: galactosamine-6-phosphate isomerase [Flavobacteriaceae bacterium]|nr:galactosamine-6-phosphate isomerase [Flavobacteriaceae bacterium]